MKQGTSYLVKAGSVFGSVPSCMRLTEPLACMTRIVDGALVLDMLFICGTLG